MSVGIISYGAYIPKYRVSVKEIASVWGKNPDEITRGLFLKEKSVPGVDEDTITIAVQAARQAIMRSQVHAQEIGALYVGSESHPYAVKPSSVTVASALGMGNNYFTADLEFACKAGTAGMQIVSSMVDAGKIVHGIAIGADTAQGKPGDALEYTAAAGGAAFMLGKGPESIAELEGFESYTSDTPDFWRGKHAQYPEHGERFTGQPAYFKHIIGAAKSFFAKYHMKPEDFDKAIFHMPNGKFPRTVAKILGFAPEQIKDSLVVDYIGNTYSGSAMLGLARTLDRANPGERIFMVSYGSGSGSDAFSFRVTDQILNRRDGKKVDEYISNKINLSYGQYAKHVGKIVM